MSLKYAPWVRFVSIGSDNGLAPSRRQPIIWTNGDPFDRRIYVALGGDELINDVWHSLIMSKDQMGRVIDPVIHSLWSVSIDDV